MRVLITGMSGFAGSHLRKLLLEQTHWTLFGISRNSAVERVSPREYWWNLDLLNCDGMRRFMQFERPDIVIHLAGQSHVPTSWENPWQTFETNVRGQLILFDAILHAKLTPRMLIVTSNEVYGAPESLNQLPFVESQLPRPNNPYAVSKVAADAMAVQYRLSHGLDIVIARPFNHCGPGQAGRFVLPTFARQVAEIEAGLREPVIQVGNMTAQRDFTDVRDVVAGYLALIKLGQPGDIYNVCSGIPRSVQSLFELLLTMSKVAITTQLDPSKFRPVDTPVSYGDNAKIRWATGWQPTIAIEQTVRDTLNEWRTRVRNSQSTFLPN